MSDLEGLPRCCSMLTRLAPVPPLTEADSGLTVDDAYAIQQVQIASRIAGGAAIVGYKVGLTSEPVRRQFGVDAPDFGHLLSDMAHAADAPIRISQFLQRRAEPEIALVLGRPLRGPQVSVSDIVAATAYAVPAIEIIDSRIAGWKIGLVDTVADNASSGGFVVRRIAPQRRHARTKASCVSSSARPQSPVRAKASLTSSA